MEFWKLHGLGNDFIAIDKRKEENDSYNDIAKKICHRRFGIGADGLLVVKNSKEADVKMLYYNTDGTNAKMCGNGLRCFCRFVTEKKIINKNLFLVETPAGIYEIEILEKLGLIKVKMQLPIFDTKKIPAKIEKDKLIEEKILINKKEYKISSVLMGVPHTIVFVDNIDKKEILNLGPKIEKLELFPDGTNVNFVKKLGENKIFVSTWERGCGYTFACGTGICASAFLSKIFNKVSSEVDVYCEGGNMKIKIEKENLYMIGPAIIICKGYWEDKNDY